MTDQNENAPIAVAAAMGANAKGQEASKQRGEYHAQ